ncbi:MAG: protein PilJ [marine bacterium B5-7]|nr:MAG: protein PilJ [marine bacterium B5-7]
MATTSQYKPLEDLDGASGNEPFDDLGDTGDMNMDSESVSHSHDSETERPAVSTIKRRSKRRGGRFIVFLLALLLVFAVGALVVNVTLEARRSAIEANQVEISSRLLMLSQRLSRQAREATLGDPAAYPGLEDSRDAVNGILAALDLGDSEIDIEPLVGESRLLLQAVSGTWQSVRGNTETILGNRDAVLSIREARDTVNELVPLLLAQSDEVVEEMVVEQADASLINLAGRQRTLTQRIRASVNEFALGESGAEVAATQFGRDLRLYGRTVRLLESRVSPPVAAKLDSLKATYQELSSAIEQVLGGVAEFFSAQVAARAINAESDVLLEQSQRLVRSISDSTPLPLVEEYVPANVDANLVFKWLPWVLGALSLLLLYILIRIFLGRAQTEARESTEENQQSQEAIMKLLDEMSDLADGDLTIEAEVTDQITGAIADSVNFAVEEMRNLVRRIKSAAEAVTMETSGSRQTADSLAQSADQQLQAINTATREIQLMAQSMQELSSDANRFTEVARSSRDVAKRGASSVRQTIQGMNDMRQQIQETAKRIKRLGESSQQINDIVSLITDIAEQTNVLSLNASIQAAMAGEAGRGFAVVADEVQRLADRSGQASRQINELVNTIQRDTNDAVSSMEQATREVVEGTNLADAAGRALVEIEQESEQLTNLIQETATKTLTHSKTAADVSNRMTTIRKTTEDAVQGVRRTAQSISNLDKVARELEESVSGFKV